MQFKKQATASIVAAVLSMISYGAYADGVHMTDDIHIDYTPLIGSPYDDVLLNQAKADGYSSEEIAVMSKLSQESGVPFALILEQVQNGALFTSLAYDYNQRLGDVYDVKDEEAKIAKYKLAYESCYIGTDTSNPVAKYAFTQEQIDFLNSKTVVGELVQAAPNPTPAPLVTAEAPPPTTPRVIVAEAPPPPSTPAPTQIAETLPLSKPMLMTTYTVRLHKRHRRHHHRFHRRHRHTATYKMGS